MLKKLCTTACALGLIFTQNLSAAKNNSLKETKDQLAQLITDQLEFATALFYNIDQPTHNFVFSPYSLTCSLSMAYLGARDTTLSSMRKTLKFNLAPKDVAKGFSILSSTLVPGPSGDLGYTLNLASAIWLNLGTYVLSDYSLGISKDFNGYLGIQNFAQKSIATDAINSWASGKTHGKITELLNLSDLSEVTRMVLTDTVYFKGAFTSPFDPKATKPLPFYPTQEGSVQTPMMQQAAPFLHMENELMQAIALPFYGKSVGGGTMALAIFLPKSAGNFSAIVQDLPHSFREVLSALKMQSVDLTLPKFTILKRSELNETLQKMGMGIPFTTDANFSGIDGMLDLYLSKVVHATYFELNEDGVTAAAASSASINIKALPPEKPPTPFVADHPFLFFLVDLKSQEMLFMGKYAVPGDSL